MQAYSACFTDVYSFTTNVFQADSGSAIYIPTATDVNIGGDCLFEGNVVDNKQDPNKPNAWSWGV